jgi:transcriptional regulator with XRE-family HTH domain
VDRSISSFGEAQLRSLGMRLRQLREARSWSLKRLSLEAGVSVAALQTIEAGSSNPGLLTIVALAEALGEPVDRLIAASRAASSTVRWVQGRVARRTEGVQELTGALYRPRMRNWVLALKGRGAAPRSWRPSVPLFALVLEGSVTLSFQDKTRETLRKGDAIHMTSDVPTAWVNSSAAAARVLCMADKKDQDD